MPGTKYFEDKQRSSLNSFINGDAIDDWTPDRKYELEKDLALSRVASDLKNGILLKYNVLRTKTLEESVKNTCYADDNLTFEEAAQCEDYVMKKDYKLKALNNFWYDHKSKHIIAHNNCINHTKGLKSVAEMDKAYADCHNDWLKDFKNNQSQELETRARNLFGKRDGL